MTTQAHKSKTPQDPSVIFEAELIESKVRAIGDYVGGVLKTCGIKQGRGCHIRFVAPGEFICFPPERVIREESGEASNSASSRIGAWSLEHIKVGAILPLREYYKEFCNYLGIAPFQLIPSSYRILAGLKVLYHILGWECPTPLEIVYFYSVKDVPVRKLRSIDFPLNEANLRTNNLLGLDQFTCDYKVLKTSKWQKVLVPADDEDKDYVACTHYLKKVISLEVEEEASRDIDSKNLLNTLGKKGKKRIAAS
uniref:Uncharacterized protein n=1 Tax=Cannabis sativa TaxID=3483 RepID=A0A803PR94_CANSA